MVHELSALCLLEKFVKPTKKLKLFAVKKVTYKFFILCKKENNSKFMIESTGLQISKNVQSIYSFVNLLLHCT